MRLDIIRVFAISKLGWIRQQRSKLRGQERETPREYVERESHYVWGKRHLLTIIESEGAPSIEVKHNRLLLRVPARTGDKKRKVLVEEWYREQLKEAVPPLISRWQRVLGVRVERFFVQRMKTRWGSCNPKPNSIRLNTDLAKRPRACLDYLVAHEMIHLIEPTHNASFVASMDGAMPQWRALREQLNRLPVRHDEWAY